MRERGSVHPLQAFVAMYWAKRRRRKGLYDHRTLAGFSIAARGGWVGGATRALAYAMFLRDLGRPLRKRWAARLADELFRLAPSQQRVALGLIAEAMPERLAALPLDACGALKLPPAVYRQLGEAARSPLALIDAMQGQWRSDFSTWLGVQRRASGLCVVGNAAALGGSRLGEAIDGCGGVVRFNQFAQATSHAQDIGRRLDVWVLSPGYRGPVPRSVQWVVVAGPDVRYTLGNWDMVLPLLRAGSKVLTVPLAVWRGLVSRLQAPPSAGVLLLKWLRDLGNELEWDGIAAASIGAGLSVSGAYHLAIPGHRAVARHNWHEGQTLVAEWSGQGLEILRAKGLRPGGDLEQ